MYTAVGDGADGGREDGLEAVGREGCVRQGWNDAVCESIYHRVYGAAGSGGCCVLEAAARGRLSDRMRGQRLTYGCALAQYARGHDAYQIE